jgi:hypothetical protein
MLHGLGDSGDGWAPVGAEWAPELRHVKFVFPHAPNVSCADEQLAGGWGRACAGQLGWLGLVSRSTSGDPRWLAFDTGSRAAASRVCAGCV